MKRTIFSPHHLGPSVSTTCFNALMHSFILYHLLVSPPYYTTTLIIWYLEVDVVCTWSATHYKTFQKGSPSIGAFLKTLWTTVTTAVSHSHACWCSVAGVTTLPQDVSLAACLALSLALSCHRSYWWSEQIWRSRIWTHRQDISQASATHSIHADLPLIWRLLSTISKKWSCHNLTELKSGLLLIKQTYATNDEKFERAKARKLENHWFSFQLSSNRNLFLKFGQKFNI